MKRFDTIVAGGGIAGLVAALGLADGGQRVAVIDAAPPKPPRKRPADHVELRVSTFSPVSLRILDAVGALEAIPDERRFVFDAMAVWESDPDSALWFRAHDAGLPELGAVIENARIRDALWRRAAERCELIEGSIEGITLGAEARVTVAGETVTGEVLLGADGGRSQVRAAAGIVADGHDYGEAGLVGVVGCERPHGRTARQRFLATGPLALLPLDTQRVSIVWTLPTAAAEEAAGLDDAAFAHRLTGASQRVLGALEPLGPRATFPLRRQHAQRYAAGCVALIGDAAHQIHPLAGQGANLGLLDAAVLVDCLLGDGPRERALRRFARQRRSDAELMGLTVHALGGVYRWTGLAGHARRLGTALVGRLPGLTGAIVRQASGLGQPLPALARPAARRP